MLCRPTCSLHALSFILTLGVWKVWASAGHASAGNSPAAANRNATETVTLWLLLRAFAAGCTAMTGVEAVSNGVSAFKDPTVNYAHRTLAAIVVVLGLLLLGIAYLARSYGVMAMDQTKEGYQSVLSQLVGCCLGARLALLRHDRQPCWPCCACRPTPASSASRGCAGRWPATATCPRRSRFPGRRLVYTVGVLFLAAGAGGLLVLFGGITDRLIPLFAVGAFLSFTLVAGRHGHALAARGGRATPTGCGSGSTASGRSPTGAALAVILAAKFTEGAWLTIVVIPAHAGPARAGASLLRHSRPPAPERRPAAPKSSRSGGAARGHLSDGNPPPPRIVAPPLWKAQKAPGLIPLRHRR